MSTFDVQIWSIVHRAERKAKPYRLRWKVAGQPFEAYYKTKALADSDRARLMRAAKEGEAFDEELGRPISEVRLKSDVTWYVHAREYVAMKWPNAAANTRRSMVEALTRVTTALLRTRRGAPDEELLRRAVFVYGLNPRRWEIDPPEEFRSALAWLERSSLLVADLANADRVREALNACATKLDGTPAAATTVARKRAVFYNALGYAVERQRLAANPIDTINWRSPEVAEAIDRRVVANPSQVASIFEALRSMGDRGTRLLGFYACIYYTGARPSEVAYLKRDDCELPESGWGRLVYVETQPRAGGHWTDDGDPREIRGLKHRARKTTRPVPAPPELVRLLREHVSRFGVGPDGRMFRSERGNPVSDSVYDRVWKTARVLALTESQCLSPLARRPYDLRHACASLWLNAGVPPQRVAQRLGHSVAVLLRVYANCIDGDDDLVNDKIDAALS